MEEERNQIAERPIGGARLFHESRVCMAPMAGYTDAPFRLICGEFGADFCVTEMVSSDGLVRGGKKTKRLLGRLAGEAPLGVQLFGSDPDVFASAAAIAAEMAPAFIDLNFGCPVKKVIRKNGGAAVMRDLGLLERICSSVVEAVDVPVTVKIRSGWSREEENFLEAGLVAQQTGCQAVTLHPRFRTQGFSGNADWSHIARLRDSLDIPVIANGDVRSPGDYFKIVDETGCSLVMIGRGAFGRPWIFREIKEMLAAGDEPGTTPDTGRKEPVTEMSLDGRIEVLERLFRMEVEWKGDRLGVIETRKFYRWFLRGHPGMKRYRTVLSTARTPEEVLGHLAELREEIGQGWTRTE